MEQEDEAAAMYPFAFTRPLSRDDLGIKRSPQNFQHIPREKILPWIPNT